MSKRMFWPVAMLVIGLILIATKLELLSTQFLNLWPIILIVVGLGGLLVSDKEEWDTPPTPTTKRATLKKLKKTTKKKIVKKRKTAKKTKKVTSHKK